MPRTPPLLALAVVLTLTGCAIDVNDLARPATPDRVRPTLDAWTDAGVVCRGPTEDNVPSGLLQWSCRGTVEGVEVSGNLDGDDQGVFGFQVVVPAATEPDAARDAFAQLVEATPPLDGLEADIVEFIDGWSGIDAIVLRGRPNTGRRRWHLARPDRLAGAATLGSRHDPVSLYVICRLSDIVIRRR